MKLSKTKLKEALSEASMECPKDIFNDALVSFFEGTLEIEGYERAQWTRFDPKDESTFPPKGKFLYFDGFGIAIGIHLQCEKKDGLAYVYRKMTHWRPLPLPPQETEEAK